MTEYDELIAALRFCDGGECDGCCRYTKEEGHSCYTLLRDAADAIDEQAIVLESYRNRMRVGNDWIPVTERLPKIHEEVLACNEEYGLSGLGFALVAVWDGTSWIETWQRKQEVHCITHWLPLPPPPRKEHDA